MAAPLKVGLNIVWFKPELQVEAAKLGEDLGFDSIWVGEHVGLPKNDQWWRKYPTVVAKGAEGRESDVAFGPDSDFLDPMVVLGAVASVTSKVRLGIGIYMLALRDAVLAARMIATVDVLSGGRLDMAIGLGWNEDEYRFTGNDWKTRGRRTDEIIRAIRVLFEEETPEFHGEFFDFGPLGFQPKPIQKPLPILVGGGTPPAEKRAGTLGNGWHGPESSIPAIRRHMADAGRADEPFFFSTITLGPVSRGELEVMASKGAHQAVVTPWPGKRVGEVGRDGFDDLERYAREIGLI
ncbi:MAG: TIGR03619 family F420-dependent LLM class oxidoreductase [Novosphingobium sp.]|nr:TIGR03619 family F420-dependent LLM class oxidoreductase [Novosphingobium sp.]